MEEFKLYVYISEIDLNISEEEKTSLILNLNLAS